MPVGISEDGLYEIARHRIPAVDYDAALCLGRRGGT